jgi:hypothetical protein
MAKDDKGTATKAPEPTEHQHKKNWGNWLWENSQMVIAMLGVILGLRHQPQAGEKLADGKEVPSWFLNLFPSLSRDDENEFAIILNSNSDPDVKIAESVFRRNLIADGYCATTYRLGLVGFRREFSERMRSPMPEDKFARMTCETLHLKDPANEFLREILREYVSTGTHQEVYERQRQIAMDYNLLEKVGTLKKIIRWFPANKDKTLALVLVVPTFLISFFIFLLKITLG